jgi:uncharacterized iron-regulated membrane protein
VPEKVAVLIFGIGALTFFGRLLWRARRRARPDIRGWPRFKITVGGAIIIAYALALIAISAYGLVERPCHP